MIKKDVPEQLLPADAPVEIIFCHGLGASSSDARAFQHALALEQPIYAIDFPSSTKYTRNPFQVTCFAQEDEIATVIEAYQAVVNKGSRAIIFGFSNGAANVVTTAGTHTLKNAAALVIIAAYDDPRAWIQKFLGSANVSKNYNPNGIRPDTVVQYIDHTIPVFIVYSLKDTVVNPDNTRRLARLLREAGHPNVHELVLKHSDHNQMLMGKDGEILRTQLHAFFKKYGIEREFDN